MMKTGPCFDKLNKPISIKLMLESKNIIENNTINKIFLKYY